MKDMFSSMRPKLKPHKTLQEAADAVENLEKELMNKLSQAVLHNTRFYFVFLNQYRLFGSIWQMPELQADQVLANDTLASIEEEVIIY